MTLYLIAIGGTGAKCAEAVVHLAAANLLTTDPVKIIFVDQDEANGNVTRAKKAVETYRQCYDLFKTDQQRPWMKTCVEFYDEVWSPIKEGNKTLGSIFNYGSLQQNKPELKHLFDVLYSQQERTTNLVDGFRGHPAIGSAAIARLTLETEPTWQKLIEEIKKPTDSQPPKIFLCGSVFGGTGASGLPTLSCLLAKKLREIAEPKIGGLLMLPYFTFPNDQNPSQEIYASPELFLLNTQVALRYYRAQAQHNDNNSGNGNSDNTKYLGFDAIYLLGMPKLSKVNDSFTLGRAAQENDPHFIELYAALAVRDFLLRTPTQKVLLISRQNDERIDWNDLPDSSQVKKNFLQATRFAYAWADHIFPDLKQAQENPSNFVRKAPWIEKFFNCNTWLANKNLPQVSADSQTQALELINQWSDTFLRWLDKLHDYNDYQIKLFNREAMSNRSTPGNFEKIVEGSSQVQKGVQYLKNRLKPETTQENNTGALGLAKALYQLCEFEEERTRR